MRTLFLLSLSVLALCVQGPLAQELVTPRLELTFAEGGGQRSWDGLTPLALKIRLIHPCDLEARAPAGPIRWRRDKAPWTSSLQFVLQEEGESEPSFEVQGCPTPSGEITELLAGQPIVIHARLERKPGAASSFRAGTIRLTIPLLLSGSAEAVAVRSPELTLLGETLSIEGAASFAISGSQVFQAGDPIVLRLAHPQLQKLMPPSLRPLGGLRLFLRDEATQAVIFESTTAFAQPLRFSPAEREDSSCLSLAIAPKDTLGLEARDYQLGFALRETSSLFQVFGQEKIIGTVRIGPPTADAAARDLALMGMHRDYADHLLARAAGEEGFLRASLVREAAQSLHKSHAAALRRFAASPKDAKAAEALAATALAVNDEDLHTLMRGVADGLVALAADAPEDLRDQSPEQGLARRAAPTDEALIALLRKELARLSSEEEDQSPAPATSSAKAYGDATSPPESTPGAPLEQWASAAIASSEYGSPRYAAAQAIGPPDVDKAGDHPKAWAPKAADRGEEWLEVQFPRPVRPTALRLHQNFNPGALVKVIAIDAEGASLELWSGQDETVYAKNQLAILNLKLPPLDRAISTLKLVFDTAKVKGWNEIDAVQLIGLP